MKVQVMQLNEQSVILKTTEGKLLEAPRGSISFAVTVGDYIIIEKVQDRTFFLPDPDKHEESTKGAIPSNGRSIFAFSLSLVCFAITLLDLTNFIEFSLGLGDSATYEWGLRIHAIEVMSFAVIWAISVIIQKRNKANRGSSMYRATRICNIIHACYFGCRQILVLVLAIVIFVIAAASR